MATVYSTQKTAWDQTTPAAMIKPNEMGGALRMAYGQYELSSTASGTVIEMFNLPDGARLVDAFLFHDALGASTTLSVGYAAYNNADGTAVSAAAAAFKAAAASTSAAKSEACNTLALLAGTEVDADATGMPVTVTLGGATGTGTVALMFFYVVD